MEFYLSMSDDSIRAITSQTFWNSEWDPFPCIHELFLDRIMCTFAIPPGYRNCQIIADAKLLKH